MVNQASGWILYRQSDSGPQMMGIYETRERAEMDAVSLDGSSHSGEWKVVDVPFIGWGTAALDVRQRSKNAPLRLVK